MRAFKKVAIIGIGLIGGSIALAIKRNGLAQKIVGVSRHEKTIILAKKIKAIDAGSLSLNIIKGADLVIFATPVKTIITLAKRVAELVGRDCLITDVGSTKKEIVSCLDSLFKNYIGSHPLAGSEKRGVISAKEDIFRSSLCIITPTARTTSLAKNKVSLFWKKLGAKIAVLSPEEHDRIIAFVSHLPHVAAFSLINSVTDKYLKFAASGLKDTTRIASSDSHLWTDILLSNKQLLKAITLFENNLKKIKQVISRQDRQSLAKILGAAKAKREKLG